MSNLTASESFGGVTIESSQENQDSSISAVISVQKGEKR
jgi:hypothetical protein